MEISLILLICIPLIGQCSSAPTQSIFPPGALSDVQGQILVPIPSADDNVPLTAKQFYKKNEDGSIHYGFSHRGQVKSEYRDPNGNVFGYYSYLHPHTKPTVVFYRGTPTAFEVSGNMLPGLSS